MTHVVDILEIEMEESRLRLKLRPAPEQLTVPPDAARKLQALLPGLGRQVCISGKNRVFRDEIVGTQSPHLLEHLCIELMVAEARLSGVDGATFFTGETFLHGGEDCPAGSAEVQLSFDHPLVAIAAVSQGAALLDWAYGLSGDKPPVMKELIKRLQGFRKQGE